MAVSTLSKRSTRAIKRPVQLPRTAAAVRNSRSSKQVTAKTDRVRGAEISVRQAAAPGQIIYGSFKVGGIYTFLDTGGGEQTKAILLTGSGNFQIAWIAKESGVSGNDTSVILEVTGTYGFTTVSVLGQQIKVRVRSSGSTPLASANEVIAAVKGNGSAMALLSDVHKGEGTGNSVVQPVAETFLQYGGGTWLHQVITLAAHEIWAVDKLFIDNREVAFGATPDPRWSTGFFSRGATRHVFMAVQLGTDTQVGQPDLIGQLPTKWTADHRQRGCAHAYIITVWDDRKFTGQPDISFQVRGKPVYDPRTTATAYSTNAALVIADYLTNEKFGLGVSWDSIDTTALIAAANVCDETVTLLGGATEPRYTISGVFDCSSTPQQILSEMSEAIAGDIVYQGGKWRILPGKWRAPTKNFSYADVRGQITVTTRKGRNETFNCARGTFASPAQEYQETDFPTVKVPTYIVEDGKEIYADFALNFVTSNTQAQRIAKIRLGQVRQPITIQTSFTLKALSLQIGDVIEYTDPLYGWSNKRFEVRSWSLKDDSNSGILIEVSLAETAEAVYTWTNAEQLSVDPAPNTSFPDFATVQAPTGLTLESGTSQLYIREDGTIFSRLKVGWTLSTNIYVENGGSYQVQYKLSSSSAWAPATTVSSESSYVYILDVHDGQSYDVRVRAVSALGIASEWLTGVGHVVLGKTEPPTSPTTLSGSVDSFGIQLSWSSVPDVDVKEYEIRLGGANWETASFIARVQGTYYRQAIQAAGAYVFRLKALDTTGNFSAGFSSTTVTIAGPGSPLITSIIEGRDVILSWSVPVSLFSIDYYEVAYGATYGARTILGTVKGTTFATRGNWGGIRKFWVTAVDVAGNAGTGAMLEVSIQLPGAVANLSYEVIDSYIKLDWDEPAAGTLPVETYRIYRGNTFGTAALLGEVAGTFILNFETIGGTFTYWVAPVDSAGNLGTESSVTAIVNNPPDLVVIADNDLNLATATLYNMIVYGTGLLGPVNPTESWTQHFVNNSFASPQAQIDAGYPLYPQPGPAGCGFQQVVDLGALIPPGYIKASLSKTLLAGTGTLSVYIFYSADNLTFYGGTLGEVASATISFRYVKIRVLYGTVPAGTFT